MNAHLMFASRDFNPEQALPPNSADLIQDLELNTLFKVMAQEDKFILKVVKTAVLASIYEPEVIRYRQDILKDCLNNPSVIRDLYQIPIDAIEQKQRRWLGIFSHSPQSVLNSSVEYLVMYVSLLRRLRSIADEHAHAFNSKGFTTFFSMVKDELGDDYLDTVDQHLKQLKFRDGALISAQLGAGLEGTDYILRQPNVKRENWLKETFSRKTPTFSFTLSDQDDAGARALGEIMDIGINSAANSLAQASEHISSFFNMLRVELAFYIGCINLKEQLEKIGCPYTFPIPAQEEQRLCSFRSMYDVCLALTMKTSIVGNEINADHKNLIMITGANQGGKSTFLRSIGLAQLMMQAGMYVPAEKYQASLSRGIFTHYKRKEDVSMKSGKLDEELSRMSTIVDLIQPNAMMLFNESFAATNEREGSEIARQITNALLDKNIRVFFVTHMYELAHKYYEKNLEDALFLRAERKGGGRRTFKLITGEPLPTSYGEDIYKTIFLKKQVSPQSRVVSSGSKME